MQTTPNYKFVIPNTDGTDLIDADLWRTPVKQIEDTLKAKYDEVMALLNGTGNTIIKGSSIGLAPDAGWNFNADTNFLACYRMGMMTARLEVTRTGTLISVGGDGNFANIQVATYDVVKGAQFVPILDAGPTLSAHAGVMQTGYWASDGKVWLGAGIPAANIDVNDAMVMFGTWAVKFL